MKILPDISVAPQSNASSPILFLYPNRAAQGNSNKSELFPTLMISKLLSIIFCYYPSITVSYPISIKRSASEIAEKLVVGMMQRINFLLLLRFWLYDSQRRLECCRYRNITSRFNCCSRCEPVSGDNRLTGYSNVLTTHHFFAEATARENTILKFLDIFVMNNSA